MAEMADMEEVEEGINAGRIIGIGMIITESVMASYEKGFREGMEVGRQTLLEDMERKRTESLERMAEELRRDMDAEKSESPFLGDVDA